MIHRGQHAARAAEHHGNARVVSTRANTNRNNRSYEDDDPQMQVGSGLSGGGLLDHNRPPNLHWWCSWRRGAAICRAGVPLQGTVGLALRPGASGGAPSGAGLPLAAVDCVQKLRQELADLRDNQHRAGVEITKLSRNIDQGKGVHGDLKRLAALEARVTSIAKET